MTLAHGSPLSALNELNRGARDRSMLFAITRRAEFLQASQPARLVGNGEPPPRSHPQHKTPFVISALSSSPTVGRDDRVLEIASERLASQSLNGKHKGFLFRRGEVQLALRLFLSRGTSVCAVPLGSGRPLLDFDRARDPFYKWRW